MVKPFISICIPAYKNTSYLKRLLDSIVLQSYSNYELIITDDSPDESVKLFLDEYRRLTNVRYFRNKPALGTPENWNEGIRHATGEWIKIMHDDDWFSGASSLQKFADAAISQPGCFIFSAYNNHFIEENRTAVVVPSSHRLRILEKEPYTLLAKNIIGPPSVTMHRNNGKHFYDRNTKWVVDIDFYIRRIGDENVYLIKEPLVNVGMSSAQVTVDCVNNRKIQVPENFYLLSKLSPARLNNIMVYDAWWRLIRNLEITDESEIREAGYQGVIPQPIRQMIEAQRKIPRRLLTNGVFSKSSMFVHYLMHSNKSAS